MILKLQFENDSTLTVTENNISVLEKENGSIKFVRIEILLKMTLYIEDKKSEI